MNKKSIILSLVLIILFLTKSTCANAMTIIVTPHEEQDYPDVLIDYEEVEFTDAEPFIDKNNRTLVPIRVISESLGCEVIWNSKNKKIQIRGLEKEIELTVGEKTASVNGKTITFDTTAEIHNNRTYVPLRFVSEALGAKVDWDPVTETVLIKFKEQEAKNIIKLDENNWKETEYPKAVQIEMQDIYIPRGDYGYNSVDDESLKRYNLTKDDIISYAVKATNKYFNVDYRNINKDTYSKDQRLIWGNHRDGEYDVSASIATTLQAEIITKGTFYPYKDDVYYLGQYYYIPGVIVNFTESNLGIPQRYVGVEEITTMAVLVGIKDGKLYIQTMHGGGNAGPSIFENYYEKITGRKIIY